MATIIEFDQRYTTEGEAARAIPHIGTDGWRITPGAGDGYQLRLELRSQAEHTVKLLRRLFPLRTFRVTQTDPD